MHDTDQYIIYCYDNSIMLVITWTMIDGLDSFNCTASSSILGRWLPQLPCDEEIEASAEQTHEIHNRTVRSDIFR
jgi:hypothetical protein